MELQWFPGHMAKTRKLISENLKLVDAVIELVDSRLPQTSRNPEINSIIGSKPRVIALNKCDMADENANKQWLNYFKNEGQSAVLLDSRSGSGFSALYPSIDKVLASKFARDREKGIKRHSVRVMVVGIPNVGKSSFINRLAGKAAAKTGDRPGVTTCKQWIRVQGKFEILDTPGILWPKFESQEDARKIAFTGGIRDEILDVEELCVYFLDFMKKNYFENLQARYKLSDISNDIESFELLELIGKKRGCVISGGEIDTFRAANIVLDDFRSVRLGRISLELPEN